MRYLETKNGFVIVVDGEVVKVNEGDGVLLFTTSGDALFYWENVDGEPRQNRGVIETIASGVMTINIADLMINVAFDEKQVKDGVPYAQTITGKFTHEIVVEKGQFMIWPTRGKMEKKDAQANTDSD